MALFTTTNWPVSALVENIDLGHIGLPELQRPFVWPNVNVRNLFDSLYRGYPAGFLLFWDTGASAGLRRIGAKERETAPHLAIVDGQQRLTSLYAVMKGTAVLRANFKREPIRLAFNPLLERFDVADAAILKDRAYIPDISVLWRPGVDLFEVAEAYLGGLAEVRELTQEQIKAARTAIGRVQRLPDYQFVALTLANSVEAEVIAEVFVRINGEGKKLNQSDFIMTLMSVFWDEGRTELEAFARDASRPADDKPSPFNHFIKPAPHQLLRVTVGLSLKRARLESVYAVLRGRDAKTGLDNPAKRDEQFALMKDGQKEALNLANWHHFLSALTLAGYRGSKMISSDAAVVFAYTLYLIGVRDYGIFKEDMRQATAEFFFMVALTGRYTSSPETRFESDLALLRDAPDAGEFLKMLRQLSSTTMTGDYWTITLPSQLATSASRSPSLFGYQAALIKLDATALYSPIRIADLVDPALKATKSAVEEHHLFPRAYLEEIGIRETKKINQIANFAQVEWPANIRIGKRPPAEYVPALDAALSGTKREQMYFLHALPFLWWELPYEEFLQERRIRMARVVKKAWEALTLVSGDSETVPPSVMELLTAGEGEVIEYKSTLRANLHTGQPDDKIQFAVLKTIAGFLNANGGTLLIGVNDDGEPLGLEDDGFPNEDRMGLHLVNLVRDRIGEVFLPYVHPHFETEEGQRVLLIRCERGPKAAFVADGNAHRFFVRGGNATAELTGAAIPEYVRGRFH